jgi:L-threonylcarbamoyladenylate synthase
MGKEEVQKAVEVLKAGGVILFPADTGWSVGCDATRGESVKRLRALTGEEPPVAVALLLDDAGKMTLYAEVPEVAYELAVVNDRPMTVIYSDARRLAPGVIADGGMVGIRVTAEPFTKELLHRFRKPVAVAAARAAGSPLPGSFTGIGEEIKQGVDHIVNYRHQERVPALHADVIKLDTSGRVEFPRG